MATYTVASGDNLSAIANEQNVSLQELKEANPQVLPPEYKLEVGQRLNMPISTSNDSGTKTAETTGQNNTKASKANDAAKAQFTTKETNQTQCPNQQEWVTVVPLRYGVQQKHADSFKPSDLKISGLKSLKRHVYVPRPIMPGFVYLFSQKLGYILEAEYGDKGTAKAASCAAGDAPSKAISGTNLQAQKDDTIELLYAPCKLPEKLTTAFLKNAALRKKYFKTVSVTSARGKGTKNASPLCKLAKFLTDCKVKSNLFDWSIQSIEAGITNSLLAKANTASPDNHIAVVLPDPITITTELALIFDAQYDVAMTSIAKTQHPYQIALTTRQIIEQKGSKAYNRRVNKVISVGHYSGKVRERTDDQIEHIKLSRKYEAEKELREHINYKQMEGLITTHESLTKNLGNTLNEESEDWLTWLKSTELNQALALYTSTEEPNLHNLSRLEASLSNMTMNLQVCSRGAELRDSWVDKHITNLSPTSEIAEANDAGWYVLLVMTGALLTEANKVNKELIGASGIDYANLAKSYSDFVLKNNFKATLATDQLNAVFGERIAQMGITLNAETAFNLYMEKQSHRYGYSLRSTQMKMTDMLNDIQHSYEVSSQQTTGSARTAMAMAIRNDTLVRTFDVSQPAPPGKVEKVLKPFAQWFVSQADRAGLVRSDALAVRTVQSAGEAFKPYAGKGLGLLLVGQVYNLYSIIQKLRSEKNTTKDIVDLFSALAGITQTSFALLQRGMFEGSEAAFKGAAKVQLQQLGLKTNALLDSLFFTHISERGSQQVTKALTSKNSLLIKSGRAAYKILPVVGNLIAVISSGFNIHSDFSKEQSLLTKTVGIASGIANTLALGCAVAALVSPAAPLVAVAGIVLAVAGIILDIWHNYLQAEELELFLKGSFWGNSKKYAHNKELSSTDSRLAYFENLTDSAVQKTAEKELAAFCHQLYKPVLTTYNYFETHNGRYENFKLNIILPGYKPDSGKVPYFKLTAKRYGRLVTLYETGKKSLIVAESRIEQQPGTQATLIQSLLLDETKRKKDFDDYHLELKHYHPAGFPVTLHYQIAIDDDSKIPLFTPDVSFKLERVI